MSAAPAVPLPHKGPTRDWYAVLGQPRRPWVDPDELKATFHQLSFASHPDRVHERPDIERAAAVDRYAELNSAYQILRDTKERLGHLLELEKGARPVNVQTVSGPAANQFFAVSDLCRKVDAFLTSRANLSSALLKARAFAEGLEWTARVQALQAELGAIRQGLEDELKQMNRLWEESGSLEGRMGALDRLEAIYRDWGFITRWLAELNERLANLAV